MSTCYFLPFHLLAATDGVCRRSELNSRPVVTIDGYEDVPQYDEVALKKAVSRQPVSVAIEADQRSFQLYMGGVYDSDDCGEQLDHGVLVSAVDVSYCGAFIPHIAI